MLTTRDIAALAGVSERTVRWWIRYAGLPAETIRQGPARVRYQITPSALAAWLRDVRPTMRKRGRPKGSTKKGRIGNG